MIWSAGSMQDWQTELCPVGIFFLITNLILWLAPKSQHRQKQFWLVSALSHMTSADAILWASFDNNLWPGILFKVEKPLKSGGILIPNTESRVLAREIEGTANTRDRVWKPLSFDLPTWGNESICQAGAQLQSWHFTLDYFFLCLNSSHEECSACLVV